ncbi:MAG TPA: long-chain fatty acid--CoA ligase, partial [Mycobacteriales bacterium]|nr:long-chain fatty acid--CoA ligase [Mycobacteriales bacterium]
MDGEFPAPVVASLLAAPDRPAVQVGSRTVTRGELLAMVRRIVTGLREAGLGRGSGVGMVLSLGPEAYAAHLAAHALGCRVAAARPGWSPAQLAHALDRGRFDAVVADVPGNRPVLLLGELLARPDPGGAVPSLARPDDVARLTYTSGSTGQPKACAHSYRAIGLAYQPDRWAPALARLLSAFQRCLIRENLASPVMFTYLGRCLVVGGTAVFPAGLAEGEAIERQRVSAALMPPARLPDLLRSPADLSSLRAVMLGGSPASPQLLRAATERLGPIVWQGYGQGETGVISILTPQDIADGHVASVGRPLPGVEVAVVDGEIRVHSPHRMLGYWDEEEQTREVVRDGWIRTRDLGHIDADGMLHLTGRARDVILVNAEVCYAGAIERVLAADREVA